MAAIHETAYPRIKPNLTYKELKEIFAPTEEELILLDSRTKKTLPIPRLGFMVTLKCYQYLGKPVKVDKIDESIKRYIAAVIGVDQQIDLLNYNQKTRKRHIKIIREYLKLNANKNERRKVIKITALDAATTKENLADIINAVIDELIKSRFELPSFKRLVRLARAARTVVNNNNYFEIVRQLTDEQNKLIDTMVGLIEAEDIDDDRLTWPTIKQEPKKPTTNNIKEFANHVNRLKSLRQIINFDLSFISPARLEQLRDEAMIADIDDMKRMRPIKRYGLVTILIYMKAASAIDDLVQIFIAWMRKIEAQAKAKLEEYRLEQADKTDEFVILLYNTLLALKNNDTAHEKVHAIENQLGGKIDELIEQCREHLKLTGEKHIAWMKKPYHNKRHVIFQLLDNLTVLSSTNDKSIENALKFILHYRYSHQEWIELDNTALVQPDLSFLSEGWLKAVTGLPKGANIKKINRHYYEMAVLTTLKNDLNCSDAYAEGAFIYDDPNKQFITWEQFDEEVDAYCDLSKLPKEPKKFIALRQVKLQETAKIVDKNYQDNPFLVINNGLPILKKLPKKKEHPDLEKLKKLIMDEMPIINIVDVIVDVENWLNLSVHFKPLSGNEVRIRDYPSRFVATSLSYGCNMGPTQTERSLSKFTRKQIAWVFNHHVTELKLIKVLKKLVNRYNLFGLPKHWGR